MKVSKTVVLISDELSVVLFLCSSAYSKNSVVMLLKVFIWNVSIRQKSFIYFSLSRQYFLAVISITKSFEKICLCNGASKNNFNFRWIGSRFSHTLIVLFLLIKTWSADNTVLIWSATHCFRKCFVTCMTFYQYILNSISAV